MHFHLLRKIRRFPKTALKRFVSDLLRLTLLSNRPRRMAQAGFVLPTTVLLVLMVVLTATALTYRTLSRSQINIAEREQVRVANVAAPAIDRAKSKIEFIFTQDPRYTSGLPTPDVLASLMLDEPYPNTVDRLVTDKDPFTLPDEKRIDINGDGKLDNAWVFTDSNTTEQVAYSILVESQGRDTSTLPGGKNYTSVRATSPINIDKAKALVTRTGPVATTAPSSTCLNARAESGWEVVDRGSSASLQKNFQINVFVPNTNNVNRTVQAFEFQQARIAERGNKWAAWFRYDLEIYPGTSFAINGAMHTDSNLIVGAFESNSKFESFKISSQNSCVYGKEASEITVGVGSAVNPFQGQIVRGSVVESGSSSGSGYEATGTDGDGKAIFHIWDGDDRKPITDRSLTGRNDSVTNTGNPADIAVNPLRLFTQDKLFPNNPNSWSRNTSAWNSNPISTGERILNRQVAKPFVDDLFRADNRWGPKPRYSETIASLDITNAANNGKKIGDPIAASLDMLDDPVQGLDGFWERQAVANGLRIIVGERLELGNPKQWNYDPTRPFDPSMPVNTTDNLAANNPENITATSPRDRLYPPNAAPSRTGLEANQYRQKRSLRDNLAAVQGMVVYHYRDPNGGEFPAACVAFTAHPGTPQTIVDSRTYDRWFTTGVPGNTTQVVPKTDFIHGQGTNGWEFKYHADFDTPGKFASQVVADAPLGIALRNLAYFAGDPKGGAPSFPAVQDGRVHPFPHQTMWGDFSALRRLVEGGHLNTAAAFNALSPADKATVHSAACTLSLLAYNLERETSDYLDLFNRDFSALTNVTERFNTLIGAITRYMRTGIMANQFKVGSKGLDTLLVERGLGRDKWWTDNQAKIRDFLIENATNPDISSLGLNSSSLTVDSLDPYFAAATGIYPGAAGEYFNSYNFEDWLAIAPYVTGGVSNSDLALLRNFADQVNQFNSIVRDRDLGFKPGLTKKDVYFNAANREITWNPSTGFTQRVDVKTGVRNINANPAFGIVDEFRDLDSNPTTPAVLVQTVVQTRKNGTDLPADSEVVEGGVRYFQFRIGSTNYKLWIDTVTQTIPDPTDATKNIQIVVQYNIKDAGSNGVPDASDTTVSVVGSGLAFKTNCDPNIFRSLGPGGGGGDNNVAVGGLIGCSARRTMPIRTPSLFYLFPLQNHNLTASDLAADFQQPAAEEYLVQMGTYNSAYSDDADLSTSGRFKVVQKSGDTSSTSTAQEIIDASIFGVRHIAAVPKKIDLTDWVLPVGAVSTTRLATTNIDANPFLLNLPTTSTTTTGITAFPAGTTAFPVSILDKGIFDGREQMAVRVADLDLQRLTSTNFSSTITEKWIPDTECVPSATVDCNLSSEGIVYAFREDAVREDEIVRPKHSSTTTSDNCLTIANITSGNCLMVTTPGSEKDPPLTNQGISLKPVDFVADPDRRPHGFRFRNGADMSNGKTRKVGMTFVTDNSVYIEGDFNLHSTAGTIATVIEEFTDKINDRDWTATTFIDDFYDGRTVAELDPNFAKRGTDTWRPVEILADAFTILSNDFLDGAAEDTFIKGLPNNRAITNTSYMNQTRPEAAQAVVREDGTTPAVEASAASPVRIDRNGRAYVGSTAVESVSNVTWTALDSSNRTKNLNLVTTPVQVNAVFISGLVPSRPRQGYGGLHNFPRTIQHWDSNANKKALIINGAFLQLNFSTAATGPYEHDAWEPGSTPDGDQDIGYYIAPTRRWGYDPGLLYYPPAAASRRFAVVGSPRSEYFRDLPADDPYITLLRCAEDKDGNPIFTDANIRGTCPS